MKTIATRTISQEDANSLRRKFIKNINLSLYWEKNNASLTWLKDAQKKLMTGKVISDGLWERYTAGAEYLYKLTHNGFICKGITCGGSRFTLALHKCKLIVVHDGRRGSYPGNMVIRIPQSLINSEDWNLIKYETSEPAWVPFNAMLNGTFGQAGFSCQKDKDDAEISASALKLEELCKFLGISLDIEAETAMIFDDLATWYIEKYQSIRNSVSGVAYRRLVASGL